MALTHPWLALGLAVAVLMVALLAWWLPARQPTPHPGQALPLAFVGRIRLLPRYRTLVGRLLRWRTIEAVLIGSALAGAVLLAARPVTPESVHDQRHSRDIVLCLDVSGSMGAVDRQVIDSYLELAGDLQGERIGFMIFDASAVTVFPLTDDQDYIAEHLRATRAELDGRQIPGTNLGEGTSLIGDGLMSCLQRFDVPETDRSRTIVLATDNHVAGAQLYTISEAAAAAAERGVLVFGIVPADNEVAATDSLTEALRTTGGDVLLLTGSANQSIEQAVRAQEEHAFAAQPRSMLVDLVWPGVLVCLAGTVAAGLVGMRRSRR